MTFKNFNKAMRVPFVIYADFEAITEKIDSCTPNPEKSYTEQYQEHKPSGSFYYVKYSNDENYKDPVAYRGEECVLKFYDMIEGEVREIHIIYKTVVPIEITKEGNKEIQKFKFCHICNRKLNNN